MSAPCQQQGNQFCLTRAARTIVVPLFAILACRNDPLQDSSRSTTSNAVTADGVELYPGAKFQDSVRKYAEGTTFLIKAGMHRLQSVTPKTGMTFVGEPGAVMSGASAHDLRT